MLSTILAGSILAGFFLFTGEPRQAVEADNRLPHMNVIRLAAMPGIEGKRSPGIRVLIPLGLAAVVPFVESGILRLVGIDQGLHAQIAGGTVLCTVAAVLAYTQLPRGRWVIVLMFIGIPLGLVLDALLDFVLFDYRRDYLPFEMGLWLAVAALPIPLGVYIGWSLTRRRVEPPPDPTSPG
jgi:uncharacterized membrane protein